MASLPLRCFVRITASLHHLGPVLFAASLLLPSSSWLLLRINTASSTGLHHSITTALSSSCLVRLSSASF